MYKFESKSKRLVVHGKNLGRVAIFEEGIFETDNEAKGNYLVENAEKLNIKVLEKPMPVVEEVVVEEVKPVEKAEIKKTFKK